MGDTESDIIELDQSLIEFLQSERDRTSVGAQALLKPYKELPKGLNHAMVTHWLGGRVQTAKRVHFDFVVSAWALCETRKTIEFTSDLLNELRTLQAVSGVTPEMIMRWSNASESGLSVSKIKHYLSGNAKLIPEEHVQLLREVWGQ